MMHYPNDFLTTIFFFYFNMKLKEKNTKSCKKNLLRFVIYSTIYS